MLVVLGFTVQIDNAGAGDDPDSAWESCDGGSVDIEICDVSTGGDCEPMHDGKAEVKTLFKGKGDKTCKNLGKWVSKALKAVDKGVKQYNKVVSREMVDIELWPILLDGKLGGRIAYENCWPRLQADGTIRIICDTERRQDVVVLLPGTPD